MNKKTIIIIISVVAALAIAIGGTILILNSNFSGATDKDPQGDITSSENSKVDGTDSKTESTPSDSNNDESSTDTPDDSTVSVPKAEKDMTTFIVGNAEVQTGSKVSVPVYVSSNKGFMAVMASFKYDTTALKYIGYKKGNLLSSYDFDESNGTIKFISVENGDITKDGVAFYLEFEAIAQNPTTTPVAITINSNGIGNKAEQYVAVDTINGNITIK